MPWVHHILVHFPIAFAVLGGGLSIAAALRPREDSRKLAWLGALLAAIAAILAVATGLLSAGHFVDDGGDAQAVAFHRNLALGGLALLVVSAGVGYGACKRPSRKFDVLLIAFIVAGSTTVLYASHAGGELLHQGLAPWSGGHTHAAPDNHSEHGDHPSTAASHVDARSGDSPAPVPPLQEPSASASAPEEPSAPLPHKHDPSHKHAH